MAKRTKQSIKSDSKILKAKIDSYIREGYSESDAIRKAFEELRNKRSNPSLPKNKWIKASKIKISNGKLQIQLK